MSKKNIKVQHPELSKTFFGAIDTSLFFTYALAQFFTGAIGDMFPQRKVLAISFTIQAVLFAFIGFGGQKEWYNLMYFVPLFCLVGLVQSVDFPCLIGTIGAWTYKSSRGIVTGFWATCSPIGNIIGLQLSVIILNLQNNHWEFQMYYITVCYFVLAGCIWFYFIGNPKDVGLVVESEVIDDDFQQTAENSDEHRINFWTAMKAPYVMLYGFSFFCVKFAVYAVLLWMPMYLREDFMWENQHIANAMTVYEIGAAIGTVVLCMLSDRNDGSRRSPTALASISVAFVISVTFWIFYDRYPQILWLIAMFCFGFTLNSIHHMIVITAAADLGRRHSSRATSTITGIIDGVGSMGNGLGQIFLGKMVESWGWRFGFLFPISLAIGFTFVPLVKIYFDERRELAELKKDVIRESMKE